jgi:hypothetical protein
MSDDGLKNEQELITFVINCIVCDGTPLDTFIDLSTAGMCHLKIVNELRLKQERMK